MRVNLIAQSVGPVTSAPEMETISLSLIVRPACGLPGDFVYPTTSAALLKMLRQDTDLPSSVLDRFKLELQVAKRGRLLAVEVSERTLTKIGYFID